MLEDRKKAPRNARIITDLRICGHFLHFKMGEKAGRRRMSITGRFWGGIITIRI